MKEIYARLSSPIQKDSIVDGEGLRTVIWFQGCPHHCPGCHNPESWNFKTGEKVSLTKLKEEIDNLEIQDGITFSGGEPMSQPEVLFELTKYAKEKKFNIWIYSGFTFDQLIEKSETEPIYLEILKNIDVLVDGKFILEDKSLDLQFKGSANQRIIDVKKSLKNNEPFLIPKYKKPKSVRKERIVKRNANSLFI